METVDFQRTYDREIAPKLPELESLRRRLRQIWMFSIGLILIVSLVFSVFVIYQSDSEEISLIESVLYGLLFTLLSCLFGSIGTNYVAQLPFRKKAKDIIIPPIARDLKTDVQILDKRARKDVIKRAQAAGSVPDGGVNVDDGFSGSYRGCSYQIVETVVKRGNSQTLISSGSFRGYVLALSVPVKFNGWVAIVPNDNIGESFGALPEDRLKDAKDFRFPSSSELDSEFDVFTNSPDEATRLMSVDFRNNFLHLARSFANGNVRAVLYDQHFYLALKDDKDRFEPVAFHRPVTDVRQGAMELVSDLTLAHRIVDALHGSKASEYQ